MKKILLATTALALSATVAAAEVKLSGDARFGLQYNKNGFANGEKTGLEKRLRFNLDASTTTDGGVTLGGRIRITSNEGTRFGDMGPVGSAVAGARVYAQYGGLTVAVGNILGAIETAPNYERHSLQYTLATLAYDYGIPGYDAFGSSTNGAEGIEVIYKQGPLQFHLSHSDSSLARQDTTEYRRTAAHLAYTFNDWTVAALMQDSDAEVGGYDIENFYGLTVGGKLGDYGVTFEAYDIDRPVGDTLVRLQGEGTFGATGVSAFVAKLSDHKTSYGIGARYNLGGNAALVGGVTRVGEINDTNTIADVGVTFRF